MAQSYDRRINLFVNIDGKEIKNNVASIRAEMSKIINAQSRMNIGSKEYHEQTAKIQSLKAILKGHAEAIGQIQTPLQKVIGFAKGLLPAFGFAALASGAKYAFEKITSGTDAMADKFEFAMAGMKNGTDFFWRTLASGDWSNFFSNFKEAVKVGYQYSKMLDTVEDQTRGLSMVESDARGEELRLEEALKNKLLSKKDRIAAGEARIQLEKDLSDQRSKIANEELDAEILISSQRTGLSREQLIQITKDIDSETKQRAEAYTEQVDQYNKLRKQNVTRILEPTSGHTTMVQLPDSEEMINLKKEFDSAPADVKAYAGALNQYGTLTVDMMDRIASAYVKKNEAEDSARENVKKVITTVNSLLAGQEDTGQKIEDKALKGKKEAADKAIEILDAANNERTAKIVAQYESEGWTDERFKSEMLAADQAYLLQKKALLASNGQSTVDVDAQINQKRIEAQAAFNDTMAAFYKENSDQQDEKQKKENEAVESTIDAVQKALDAAERLKDQEAAALKEREQAYLDFALSIGSSMGQLMNDQEASFDDYLKSILVMSLEALHQFYLLKLAEVWIDAAAGAATGRFWKIAGAVAAVAAMEAAYQGVKVALTSKKEKSSTSKYASGGFTHGETYIAGEAGTEFIAPNWMVNNPLSGPIIAGLESWRRNPITVSQAAIETSKSFSGSARSVSGSQTPTQSQAVAVQTSTDPELKKVLEENTKAIRDFIKWKPEIAVETYERKRENWTKMTQSGLKA